MIKRVGINTIDIFYLLSKAENSLTVEMDNKNNSVKQYSFFYRSKGQ